MKPLFAAVVLSSLATASCAAPSKGVIDACGRAASDTPKVSYAEIAANAFEVTEDEDAKKTETVLHHGKDTVGVWEVKEPKAFGLLFNGKEIPLGRVSRLDREQAPESFNPYEAVWGAVREGKRSYICAAFNFDGLGKSGSFQDVRGVYVIERQTRPAKVYYTVGKFVHNEK